MPVDLERIRTAARTGTTLDLRRDDDRAVDSDALLSVYEAQAGYDPRGFILRGAWFAGETNWSDRQLRGSVTLVDCAFEDGLDGSGMRIDGDLLMLGCELPRLTLDNAIIGRTLGIKDRGTVNRALGLRAELTADRIRVGSDLVIQYRSSDRFSLRNAVVAGRADFSRSEIRGSAGVAIDCDHAEFRGSVDIDNAALGGQLRLFGATVANSLSLSSVSIVAPGGEDAVVLDAAQVGEDLKILGCSLVGSLNMRRTRVDGTFVLDRCLLDGSGRSAIDADHMRARGDVEITSSTVLGETCLSGARIEGRAVVRTTLLCANPRSALVAEGLTVNHGLTFGPDLQVRGTIDMKAARIESFLDFIWVTAREPAAAPDEPAFRAERLQVEGNMRMWLSSFTGPVLLNGASIQGRLNMNRSKFHNPGGYALRAPGIDVSQDVWLSTGFEAHGSVDISDARIGGNLSCRNGTFNDPLLALDGEGVRVDGRFEWSHLNVAPEGLVDLTMARVGQLCDSPSAWPTGDNTIWLSGLEYELLGRGSDKVKVSERLTWLRNEKPFTPEPYLQLASTYRKMGHDKQADRVLMAREVDLRKSGAFGLPRRLWSYFLGATIGHGYRLWPIALFLLAIYLASVLVVQAAADGNAFIPVNYRGAAPAAGAAASAPGDPVAPEPPASSGCTPTYPCLNEFTFPIDYVVPVAGLKQTAYWQPDTSSTIGRNTSYWLAFSTLMGWLSVTLLLVALTGLVQRDRRP